MTKTAAKAEAALEAAEPEEEVPHLGATVERAKSGRSLCKECRLPIAEGALRIGGARRGAVMLRRSCARADVEVLVFVVLRSGFCHGQRPGGGQSVRLVAPSRLLQPA
jgi:hypothetical protein